MAHRTEKFFARFGVLFGAFSYLLFASGAAAQEADQTKSTHLPNGTKYVTLSTFVFPSFVSLYLPIAWSR